MWLWFQDQSGEGCLISRGKLVRVQKIGSSVLENPQPTRQSKHALQKSGDGSRCAKKINLTFVGDVLHALGLGKAAGVDVFA